jgi:copper(I)-binding protein
MVILNTGDIDDRLIAAEADISMRVELHTHVETADGVMQMREVEDGFVVPAGRGRVLQRGGDHVMFMGLKGPMEQGATVPVTLIFENAGAVAVEIPVDLNR